MIIIIFYWNFNVKENVSVFKNFIIVNYNEFCSREERYKVVVFSKYFMCKLKRNFVCIVWLIYILGFVKVNCIMYI